MPLLLVLLILALFAGNPDAQCPTATTGGVAVTPNTVPAGLTEQQRGCSQRRCRCRPVVGMRAGATAYHAGDGMGTGTRGGDPRPRPGRSPRHPDTFAELSPKTVNTGITFETANALGAAAVDERGQGRLPR